MMFLTALKTMRKSRPLGVRIVMAAAFVATCVLAPALQTPAQGQPQATPVAASLQLAGSDKLRKAADLAINAASLDPTATNYNNALRLHRSWVTSVPKDQPERLEAVRENLNLYDSYLRVLEANPAQKHKYETTQLNLATKELDNLLYRNKTLPPRTTESMREQVNAFWDRNRALLVARKKSTLEFEARHFQYVLRRQGTTPSTPKQVVAMLHDINTQWNEEKSTQTDFPASIIFIGNVWDSANIADKRGKKTAALLRRNPSPHLQAAGWLRELWVTRAGENTRAIEEILNRFIAGKPGKPPQYLRSGSFDSDFAGEIRNAKTFLVPRAEKVLRRVAETQDAHPWIHYRDSLTQLIGLLPPAEQSLIAEQALAILEAPNDNKKSSLSRRAAKGYSEIVKRNAHALAEAEAVGDKKTDLYMTPITLAGSKKRGVVIALSVHTPINADTPWIYGVQFESKGKLALFRWSISGQNPRRIGQFDAPADIHPINVKPEIFPGHNRVFVAIHNTLHTIENGKVTTLSTASPTNDTGKDENAQYATDGKRLFIAKNSFLGYLDPDASPQIVAVTSYSRKAKNNALDGLRWRLTKVQCDPFSGDVYLRINARNTSPFWRFDSKTLTPRPSTGKLRHADALYFTPSGPLFVRREPRAPLSVMPVNPETMTLDKARPFQTTDEILSSHQYAVQGNYGVSCNEGWLRFYYLPTAWSTFFRDDPSVEKLYPLADGTLLGLNIDRDTGQGHGMSLYKIRSK